MRVMSRRRDEKDGVGLKVASDVMSSSFLCVRRTCVFSLLDRHRLPHCVL